MKYRIKHFFAIAFLTIGFVTNNALEKDPFTLTGQIITLKIQKILDPTNTEVKEWRAWVQDILCEIPETAKSNNKVKEIIKALEKVQRFKMIDAIGAFLKNNKDIFPPDVVAMVQKISREEFKNAVERRIGKKI